MIYFSGVGARKTPTDILRLMRYIGTLLSLDGYGCKTGAAQGADQAFGRGVCMVGGVLELWIPWPNFEKIWWKTLFGKVTINVLQDNNIEAYQSVINYHPNHKVLTQGQRKLVARNYPIVKDTKFLICWTPNGEVVGGTGQALRIAHNLGVPTYNLGDKKILSAFIGKVNERKEEIPNFKHIPNLGL